jgi:hypothetical protein
VIASVLLPRGGVRSKSCALFCDCFGCGEESVRDGVEKFLDESKSEVNKKQTRIQLGNLFPMNF